MTSLETLGGFVGRLGLRLAESDEDRVVIRWPVRAELLQPDGTVHRGVFCTVVETAASTAATSWLGDAGRAVPVSMQMDFVADARDGELTATARPIHPGSRPTTPRHRPRSRALRHADSGDRSGDDGTSHLHVILVVGSRIEIHRPGPSAGGRTSHRHYLW